MQKNWAEIADIKNSYIQYALIQATGDDITALAVAYPQCFCEQYDRISLSQLLSQVRAIEYEAYIVACKASRLPYIAFNIKGAVVSESEDGLPLKLPYGKFYHSGVKAGSSVKYMGSEWVIVWNYFCHGNFFDPAVHFLILVPSDALKK